jgi:hypothetical protein
MRSFAFVGALVLHAAITGAWYATMPHSGHLSTVVPWAGLFLCGVVFGLLDARPGMANAVVLGVLMPVLTSLIHLIVASIGAVEDARTPGVAFLLAAMLMTISIPLSCAGALLGGWLRKGT